MRLRYVYYNSSRNALFTYIVFGPVAQVSYRSPDLPELPTNLGRYHYVSDYLPVFVLTDVAKAVQCAHYETHSSLWQVSQVSRDPLRALTLLMHKVVVVDQIPPRAELQQLGITYRRIPVMAIGNDLYFDTSLIVAELERRFGPEKGHPSLLMADKGLQEAAVSFWNDRVFFLTAMTMIPKIALSPAVAKDRAEFLGDLDAIDRIDENRPAGLSALRTHLVRP